MSAETPWTPPADLTAERQLVSLALVCGPRAPASVWTVRAADLYDYRHRALWATATTATKSGCDPTADAALAHISPRYLAGLSTIDWPTTSDGVADLARRVRTAAATRRMLDACWHLAAAWADDDRDRWATEIANIAAAAAGL